MATYNERGVIAENYYDLQGLGVLDAARDLAPLRQGSLESTLRTVLQAVEIAILNLADLLGRAAKDLENEQYGSAMVKITWARGFHRVLGRLSVIPQQLGGIYEGGRAGVLNLADSPALNDYLDNLKKFDQIVLGLAESRKLALPKLVGDASIDNAEFSLIHLARIMNHESKIWESNLGEINLPIPVSTYRDWVLCDQMREAVYERVLRGDTFFTQFRGLHQIPELLVAEVSSLVEMTIHCLRQKEYVRALKHLDCVSVLMEGILSALPPMVDSLATSDYHAIRENLGQTSGSHSVGIRYHLFTDLYEQLAETVADCLTDPTELSSDTTGNIGDSELDEPADAAGSSLLSLVVTNCLKLRAHIFQWRDQHLHLPRNNLGGESTKSLTGSPDAVAAVQRMGDSARTKDPAAALARGRELSITNPSSHLQGKLTQYLLSPDSLDARILADTGRVTQERFAHVQERLGYFATTSRFVRPQRREV